MNEKEFEKMKTERDLVIRNLPLSEEEFEKMRGICDSVIRNYPTYEEKDIVGCVFCNELSPIGESAIHIIHDPNCAFILATEILKVLLSPIVIINSGIE